jgi:cytochrome o ubiquinol oxidase subunit 2
MKKAKLVGIFLLVVVVILATVLALRGHNFAVLNADGIVGRKERNLIVFASLLSLIVVIPVFVMLFGFAWKYREGNKKATYKPDWDHSRVAETIWWVVPLILIGILGIVAWNSSHDLDPYKALVSNTQPIQVQVVALDWKWLFIYPQLGIASVNFLEFPVDTPVNYTVTADAPMNSFWIPALGGQVYAMPGMSTQLHLMASKTGDFKGSSANISGKGFAGMKFVARSSTSTDFAKWVKTVKKTPKILNQVNYASLAMPSENNPASYYSTVSKDLYDGIVMKYMVPAADTNTISGMSM